MTTSKISGTSEAVLDFNDLLRVHLKNDNVQGADTKWDEELSIRKVPDEDILEIPYQNSSSAQRDYNLLCRCISRIQC